MTTTTNASVHTATRQAMLGHLALHYMPGDEHKARRLLELLGCTLVDNGPVPGADGFCTVLVNGTDANYADNIMFLSSVTAEESMTVNPESTSHIGLRFQNLEGLEQTLAGLETATAPGGELEGRVQLVKYSPRPGDDAAASATAAQRVAASPAFSGRETPSFAPYWIQCFVTTDLCGFGILTFGSIFELDYVFEPFFKEPPTFGRRPS
jgi:hypothetical protein